MDDAETAKIERSTMSTSEWLAYDAAGCVPGWFGFVAAGVVGVVGTILGRRRRRSEPSRCQPAGRWPRTASIARPCCWVRPAGGGCGVGGCRRRQRDHPYDLGDAGRNARMTVPLVDGSGLTLDSLPASTPW